MARGVVECLVVAADRYNQEFVQRLSARTGHQRLMSARHPSLEELRLLTDIDHQPELALIATTPVQDRARQIGVARYVKESPPRA